MDLVSKKWTIEEGDFKNCPSEYRDGLMRWLNDFKDRFMSNELDIELTKSYEAELETLEGKKVCEKAKKSLIKNLSIR